MATEVVMPRLGWTMEVGRVVEWLKNDGDTIEEGDLILAIESDKAVNEVEAMEAGILRIPADPQIGVELPVGARLGYIVQPGDPDPFDLDALTISLRTDGAGPAVAPRVSASRVTEPAATAAGANGNAQRPAISPRARRAAARAGIDWTAVLGSGSTGRIRERDVLAAIAAQPSVEPTRAAPSVRRLAEDTGVDLNAVPAGRPGGRITRADVLNAARQPDGIAKTRNNPALPRHHNQVLIPHQFGNSRSHLGSHARSHAGQRGLIALIAEKPLAELPNRQVPNRRKCRLIMGVED